MQVTLNEIIAIRCDDGTTVLARLIGATVRNAVVEYLQDCKTGVRQEFQKNDEGLVRWSRIFALINPPKRPMSQFNSWTAAGVKVTPTDGPPDCIRHIPALMPHAENELGSGVYFLCFSGALMYVGQATCLSNRVRQQRAFRRDSAFYVECPSEFLDECESYWIKRLRPLMNLAGNPDWKGRGSIRVPLDESIFSSTWGKEEDAA